MWMTPYARRNNYFNNYLNQLRRITPWLAISEPQFISAAEFAEPSYQPPTAALNNCYEIIVVLADFACHLAPETYIDLPAVEN
jgi:hypothetical protein